jgi:single-strand DNA-binding protein
MASGFQTFVGSGNLTRDAESRQVGEAEVAKYSIAINGRKDRVLFLDCEQWRPGGVLPYLLKGTSVIVQGELELQTWEKDGQQRSKMVLSVNRLQLNGGRPKKDEVEEFAEFSR